MKWSRETLHNLPYFWNSKTTHVIFLVFFSKRKKTPKTTWAFICQKYGKCWSIFLDNFIKHKPDISEEWSRTKIDVLKKNSNRTSPMELLSKYNDFSFRSNLTFVNALFFITLCIFYTAWKYLHKGSSQWTNKWKSYAIIGKFALLHPVNQWYKIIKTPFLRQISSF